MTGQELKAIRMFNNINQTVFANKLGYSTTNTLRKMESADFIPQRYVQLISEIIGIDFTNHRILDDYMRKIPVKYKSKNKIIKRRPLWCS